MNSSLINPIAIGLMALAASSLPVRAAKETVLYSFTDSCCGYPQGRLYLRGGTLYGTAFGNPNQKGAYGQVFKLTQSGGSWKERSLLAFDGSDGSAPNAGLIRNSNGTLFGTASMGDVHNGGNVFALSKSGGKWVEQTIWAFGGTAGDGTQPLDDLVIDKSGNLFGTTYSGGTYNFGTAFELSNVNGIWTETVLHSFTGKNGDGWFPYAGLLMGGSGTLYGTTMFGGGGDGTVFSLSQSGGVWKEKVLYVFTGGADGGEPWGTLIKDKNGALYGTTHAGGAWDVGVVFMLSRSGGKRTETVLHTFPFQSGSDDGYWPAAGLTWGPSGTLYGTTFGGNAGAGTAFELTQTGGEWTETVLHQFGENGDGGPPQGSITIDQNGALYGTTVGGGTYDLGTVWKIVP